MKKRLSKQDTDIIMGITSILLFELVDEQILLDKISNHFKNLNFGLLNPYRKNGVEVVFKNNSKDYEIKLYHEYFPEPNENQLPRLTILEWSLDKTGAITKIEKR